MLLFVPERFRVPLEHIEELEALLQVFLIRELAPPEEDLFEGREVIRGKDRAECPQFTLEDIEHGITVGIFVDDVPVERGFLSDDA